MTRAICGRIGSNSSASQSLSLSLANRFQLRTAALGSTLYGLTWKAVRTPLAFSIPTARASARRTSDSDFTGWPSPTAEDARSSRRHGYMLTGHAGTTLLDAALMAGWVTPAARDYKDSPGMATTGTNPDGSTRGRVDQLPRQAYLARTSMADAARLTASGVLLTGCDARMDSGDQLNPGLSRWLQGFPAVWCDCAVTETPSTSKSDAPSSKPI